MNSTMSNVHIKALLSRSQPILLNLTLIVLGGRGEGGNYTINLNKQYRIINI